MLSRIYFTAPNGGQFYPTDEYLGLFSNNDRRKQLFLLRKQGFTSIDGVDDGIRVYNIRDDKLTVTTVTDSKNEGITFPILLLTRAEAYARQRQTALALADLNSLRFYRYARTSAGATPGASPETDLTGGAALSADEFLYEILKERRREWINRSKLTPLG